MNKPHRLSGREGRGTSVEAPKLVRCAIYTRKSTEEGLEQEFNTLHAQRESAEAYIRSQAHEGWTAIATDYDDGGYTGGNMDRPGLARLLSDIEAGRVDCVVVYKVDRLSRSLLDFARMLEIFERHKVAFVSVTQQFNTANSMGRLMLNVLLSFAQFEREIISERTRDKIAAARRKGKWSGGIPILGYDTDPGKGKIVVNPVEAEKVRAIFGIFQEQKGLIATVRELEKRGWRNKSWITRKGTPTGGLPFNKSNLARLLSNVTYVGQIRYKREVNPGQHEPIVPQELWDAVQSHLGHGTMSKGTKSKNQYGALLRGLVHCAACDCAMTPAHSTKSGNKRYRYYVCVQAQKRGWDACPSKSVPAGELEKFVVGQIARIGKDPEVVSETLSRLEEVAQEETDRLRIELGAQEQELLRWSRELAGLKLDGSDSAGTIELLASYQDRIFKAQTRIGELRTELEELNRHRISDAEATEALSKFEPVWVQLSPRERYELVGCLVERVSYDARRGNVAITFHASGIKVLSQLAGGAE